MFRSYCNSILKINNKDAFDYLTQKYNNMCNNCTKKTICNMKELNTRGMCASRNSFKTFYPNPFRYVPEKL